MIELEVLAEDNGIIECPCCGNKIVPFIAGRSAVCGICDYRWVVTCIASKIKERPELRKFHHDVWIDTLREKYQQG